MKLLVLTLLAAVLLGLHQGFWMRDAARPLFFGFLPVALAYHGLLTIAAAGFLTLCVKLAWPAHLDERGRSPNDSRTSGGEGLPR